MSTYKFANSIACNIATSLSLSRYRNGVPYRSPVTFIKVPYRSRFRSPLAHSDIIHRDNSIGNSRNSNKREPKRALNTWWHGDPVLAPAFGFIRIQTEAVRVVVLQFRLLRSKVYADSVHYNLEHIDFSH
jgi:hypothetical protein